MLNCFFVGIGGFVGAVLRYLISLIPVNEIGSFPYKTFFINVIGSFFIGIIIVMAMKNASLNPRWILFLKVGICGGFTTFSTFALESATLFQTGKIWTALFYIVLSIVFSVVACMVPQWIFVK